MGIEGFAGADYEGSIDLDLISGQVGQRLKRQMNRLSETAVTEDTLREK